MKPLLFSLYTPLLFLEKFKNSNQFELGNIEIRQFPDQETYVKFNSEVKKKQVIFIASLDRPNEKLLPLLFALKTARELGAQTIGLIIPYLPYMRQDYQFLPGEAVTSKHFAKIISDSVDWIITIDPHLHRYPSLSAIYDCHSYVLHATQPMSDWIQQNVPSPIIIGPDSESAQWIAGIAKNINAPYKVLNKTRIGDRQVQIKFPVLNDCQELTPVLVDDIISTGATLIETVSHLKNINMKPSICIGVHALFSKGSYDDILSAGAKSIITCNTIEHHSNAIDISSLILDCLSNIFHSH